MDEFFNLLEANNFEGLAAPDSLFPQEPPSNEAATLSPLAGPSTSSYSGVTPKKNAKKGGRTRMKPEDYKLLTDEMKNIRKLLQNKESAARSRARRRLQLMEDEKSFKMAKEENDALLKKKERLQKLIDILILALKRRKEMQ